MRWLLEVHECMLINLLIIKEKLGAVHTEKFKTQLFSTVYSPTEHSNPLRKRIYSFILQTGRIWKRFENDDVKMTWFSFPTFLPKLTYDSCFFKFVQRSRDGKHFMRFQAKYAMRAFNSKRKHEKINRHHLHSQIFAELVISLLFCGGWQWNVQDL